MSKRYRTKHSRRTVCENECKATAKAPPELNASRSPLAKYCTTGKHTVCKKEQEILHHILPTTDGTRLLIFQSEYVLYHMCVS